MMGKKREKNFDEKKNFVLDSLTCDFHHRLVFFLLFFTGSLCATVRPEFFFKAKNVEKSPPFWTLTFDLDLQGVTRYTQDTYPDQVSSRSSNRKRVKSGWLTDWLTMDQHNHFKGWAMPPKKLTISVAMAKVQQRLYSIIDFLDIQHDHEKDIEL